MANARAGAARGWLAATFSLILVGCTVHVTEDSVLPPDTSPAPLDLAALQAPLHARLEPLALRYADGVVGHGVHLAAPAPKAVIVYLAGNEMRLAEHGPRLLPRFESLGVDVYWVDRRGLGATGGTPDMRSLASDAEALVELAARRGKPVIVHGLSLGSLLAGRAAADRRVSALVLEGALPSIPLVADGEIPSALRGVVTAQVDPQLAAFDNLAVLRTLDKPLLVLAGSRDTVIPPRNAKLLYQSARTPEKTLVIADGKGHVDTMTSDAAIAAYRTLIDTLQRRGKPEPAP